MVISLWRLACYATLGVICWALSSIPSRMLRRKERAVPRDWTMRLTVAFFVGSIVFAVGLNTLGVR